MMKKLKNLRAFQTNVPVLCSLETSLSICVLKVNNRNTRVTCEICSKLTVKTPERRY